MATAEIHIELAVNYGEDPKMRALARFGRDARACRDLYVQMTCYCKRNLTDGFVPAEELGVLVYPDTPRNGERDAGRLVEVGLIERVDGGFRVCAYIKRNRSKAEVLEMAEKKASGGSLGNHIRWHEEQGLYSSKCRFCQESDSPPDPSSDPDTDRGSNRSTDRPPNRERSPKTKTETETETETETDPPAPRRGKSGSRRPTETPEFATFWETYPRKVGKAKALEAWHKAITAGTPPDVIIAGAQAYVRDPVRRSSDIKFTAHPATWINQERWADEAPVLDNVLRGGWWNN
jgi:hypothetical protein